MTQKRSQEPLCDYEAQIVKICPHLHMARSALACLNKKELLKIVKFIKCRLHDGETEPGH